MGCLPWLIQPIFKSSQIITVMSKIRVAEHLYELYPSMPRYANDPEESQVVKLYDFLLRRFQGFYGKQPKYFVKAPASPVLLGDENDYVDFPYFSFSSTQDIILAVATSSSDKIKINNYQSAIYGEKVIESSVASWKFDEKEGQDRFTNVFTKILTIVADELNVKDLGGLDILIYTGYIEDEFMGWKESLFAAFYVAITTVLTKGKIVEEKSIFKAIDALTSIDIELKRKHQLTNYHPGHFALQNTPKPDHVSFPNGCHIVIAHSLTPLPKKLIQGKRFNLRRCEILIAIQYLKIAAGTSKPIKSLKQLRETIQCTTEQLIQEIEENIPNGKLTAQEIEQFTEQTLIDILKEVPYANNVIDQNTEYFPRNRALFFLKEQILIRNLNGQNLIPTIQQSYRNQVELLGIGSQQIEQLIEVGKPWSLAHKVVGNGWGGNIMFICEKAKSGKLAQDIVSKFYLSNENKVLLSDDIDQYIHIVQSPATGLAVLDPQSEIWF